MDILYSNEARRALKRLDSSIRMRILNGVKGLEEIPPEGDIKRLTGRDTAYRMRMGDYRILFHYQGNTVIIDRIAPRGQAYK